MPITNLSFRRPPIEYLDESLSISSGGNLAAFGLEIDVKDNYDLESILRIEGGTIDDVNFEVNSNYATIEGGRFLKAIKHSAKAKEYSAYPDYIILTAKAKSGSAQASILVRIYDTPTHIELITEEIKDGQTVQTQSNLAIKYGLEVKPGDSFTLDFKVLPSTAQQCIRLVCKNKYMMENIKKMSIKDQPGDGKGKTKFTLSDDAHYYCGVIDTKNIKEAAEYYTYLMTKRRNIDELITETANIQVVQYYASDPKPLDFLVTSLPLEFKYNYGGRLGTIDGGLRISKDADGRTLIKDDYTLWDDVSNKSLLKYHAKAIIIELNPNGSSQMKVGIEFTAYFDPVEGFVSYEPDPSNERSKYKDCHGYAVAVHPYGKKMTWSDQGGAIDYSLTDAWKEAGDDYNCTVDCTSQSGYRLTSHYHYYNRTVPQNKSVNPVRCLKDYHNKWRSALYRGKDSDGSDVVSFWFIPSIKDCMKMSMDSRILRRALAERINYLEGDLQDPSRFWTSSLVKKDFSKVECASWSVDYGTVTIYVDKNEQFDFRPFHRF